MGIGVEINEKWAVNVAWEFNHSVFITMEPPVLDTIHMVHIFALEVVRVFHLPRSKVNYLRAGINTGLGVERTNAYEYADNAVKYFERAVSQRLLGSNQKNRAFVGMVVGLTAGIVGIDYRPKLYGLGDENAFVHSGGLTLRIPLGSL